MNLLKINTIVIPDSYVRMYMDSVDDMPDNEEGDAIMYEDKEGCRYVLAEGLVYVWKESYE